MRLMEYLPELYALSKEVQAFQGAFQPEIDLIWEAREELLTQLDPRTATWGLSYWEMAFGLSADSKLSYAQRRSKVIARIRGMGATTLAMLQAVAAAFSPSHEAAVTERYGEYLVEIHLAVERWQAEDADGLREILKLIMPAHLLYKIAYDFTPMESIARMGGALSSSTVTPLMELPDEMSFNGEARIGGRLSAVTSTRIPEL